MSEKAEADRLAGKVHRALADEHRARIVDELRRSRDGLDVHELGKMLGLHANTVRWHLGVLADAGIVGSHPGSRSSPGRPRTVYVLDESADDAVDADSHRLLVTVLSGALSELPDGREHARRAGAAWGHYLVRRPPNAHLSDEDAKGEVVELLREQGFRASDEGEEIRMYRCPYRELAPGIVCNVHEGLIDGALAGLGSNLGVEHLVAYAEPGVCIAQLRRRDPA